MKVMREILFDSETWDRPIDFLVPAKARLVASFLPLTCLARDSPLFWCPYFHELGVDDFAITRQDG